MKNGVPEASTSCSKCHINVAMLPFHDRETWINGFCQGIGNRMTILENEVCFIGITGGPMIYIYEFSDCSTLKWLVLQ